MDQHDLLEREKTYYDLIQKYPLGEGGFYYSNSYDLTNSLQKKFSNDNDKKKYQNSLNLKYTWNFSIAKKLIKSYSDVNELFSPVINGYFGKKSFNIKGSIISFILISRRANGHVGVRYFSRGLNGQGDVSNEVETEQIVTLENNFFQTPHFITSAVFYRGSIPFYWGNEYLYSPKPSIIIHENKDKEYIQTDKYFESLKSEYGEPIICFNLVRGELNHREFKLKELFEKYLKDKKGVEYFYFDMLYYYQIDPKETIKQRFYQGLQFASKTQFFYFEESLITKRQKQNGVVRINCIDCLDRTNNAMACIGIAYAVRQLESLGFKCDPESLEFWTDFANEIFRVYAQNGDNIALQYAGSEAFHRAEIKANSNKNDWMTKNPNQIPFVIRRYLSNTIFDYQKHKAINLFHRKFRPSKNKTDLVNINVQDLQNYLEISTKKEKICIDVNEFLQERDFEFPKRKKLLIDYNSNDPHHNSDNREIFALNMFDLTEKKDTPSKQKNNLNKHVQELKKETKMGLDKIIFERNNFFEREKYLFK